jgi:hypothetical protein
MKGTSDNDNYKLHKQRGIPDLASKSEVYLLELIILRNSNGAEEIIRLAVWQ